MKKIIYPKGSIICKKDDVNQYCIVDINNDGYEVINYPFGVQGLGNKNIIKYEEVGSLFFWGYMGEEYKKKIKTIYKDMILNEKNQ